MLYCCPATNLVIPAAAERRAGIQERLCDYWITAFAGNDWMAEIFCLFAAVGWKAKRFGVRLVPEQGRDDHFEEKVGNKTQSQRKHDDCINRFCMVSSFFL